MKNSGLILSLLGVFSAGAIHTQAGASFPISPSESEAAPMNFVVIFSDEMPPEYVGAYGGGKYPTPNIDRLAQDGQRFTSAFSVSPMCTPARYAVITGRYPGRCTERTFVSQTEGDFSQPYKIEWNTSIDGRESTLLKQLVEQGYNTGISGKWHLSAGHNHPPMPSLKKGRLDRPETLKKMVERQQIVQDYIAKLAGFTMARSMFFENCEEEPLVAHHNIPYITRGAVEILREFSKADKPFFLITTPTGIHGPWHADVLEKDLRYTPGGYVADIYDYAPDYAALKKTVANFSTGEKHKRVGMADLDHLVGRIRAELKTLELAKNTVIIFTADHGIEPGKASVYDRGLRVPLVVYWPGLTMPGTVSDSLAQHVDLSATIAQFSGVPQDGKIVDGVDLRPVFLDSKQTVRDYAYFECGYSRAVTDGRYKLISIRLPAAVIAAATAGEYQWLTVGMGGGSGAHAAFSQLAYPAYYEPDQLYDLKQDPYEQVSLWNKPEFAPIQARLRKALAEKTDAMPFSFPTDPSPFFASKIYKELTERTLRENDPSTKSWVKRDHDAVIWPPAKP